MARNTRRTKAAATPPSRAEVEARVVDAALALAADRPWGDVTLADIAAAAGLGLADLYPRLRSKTAVLAAFARRIDAEMLALDPADLAGERPRDRLFDVVMRRYDLLAPHKDAVRSMVGALRRDPVAALALVPAMERSMAWTLEAAGIDAAGWRGRLRVRGLIAIDAAVLRVWLDDGPEQARTMAELDRRLASAESWALRLGIARAAD